MRLMASVMAIALVLGGGAYGSGDSPFVLGGDPAAAGKAPAVPAPPCPVNSVFGQQGVASDGSWNAWHAEALNPWVVCENFWGVTDEICGVRWWGILRFSSGVPCNESDHTFTITFWEDEGGLPGDPIHVFEIEATQVNTGIDYVGLYVYRLFEYRASFPYCLSLPSGWISVAGQGDPHCGFYWLISPHGDGGAYHSVAGPIEQDFAMCLTTLPPCPGDSSFSQRPLGWHHPLSGVIPSDVDADILAYDNFWGLSENICDVRWWGLPIDFSVPGLCGDNEFDITFYEDEAGEPGAEVCRYSVVAERRAYLDPDLVLHEFHADLPSCCRLTSGWLSIEGRRRSDC